MKLPWLDLLLVAVTLVGAVFAWQSAAVRGVLQPEYERLRLLTGELTPKDASKVYVRAIATDSPLEYAWRAYFPPNYSMYFSHSSGSSRSGSHSDPVHAIIRVRLRKVDGRWMIYEKFPSASSLSSLNPDVATFLEQSPEAIVAEQVGRTAVEQLPTDRQFTLLKLMMPQAAKGEDAAEVSVTDGGKMHTFFELKVGKNLPTP